MGAFENFTEFGFGFGNSPLALGHRGTSRGIVTMDIIVILSPEDKWTGIDFKGAKPQIGGCTRGPRSLVGFQERSFSPDGRSGQTPFVGCLVNMPPPRGFFISVHSKGS